MDLAPDTLLRGAFRSFVLSFATVLGVLIAIVAVVMGFSFFSNPYTEVDNTELVLSPDTQGNREQLSTQAPVILKINIHGVIGTEQLSAATIQNFLYKTQDDPLKHRVKALLLDMNTPGGTVEDSDAIFRLIKTFKEKNHIPVYAYVQGLCASGGMMISAAADQIFSSPASWTGSIGVRLGPVFNFSGAMEKVGIQSLTLTGGKGKDMLNPFRPWAEGEDQSLREIMARSYQSFVDLMTISRPRVNKEKLIEDYGAHIFDNVQALEYGFIDVADSSYNDALSALVKAAHIDGEKYQVVEPRIASSFFANLVQGKCAILSGKIEHSLYLGPYVTPELSGKLLYLYPGVLTSQ